MKRRDFLLLSRITTNDFEENLADFLELLFKKNVKNLKDIDNSIINLILTRLEKDTRQLKKNKKNYNKKKYFKIFITISLLPLSNLFTFFISKLKEDLFEEDLILEFLVKIVLERFIKEEFKKINKKTFENPILKIRKMKFNEKI